MINLSIGEKKVKLPNQWSELTVAKYARVIDIFNTHEATPEFKENKTPEQHEFDCLKANKESFAFLTGCKNEEIEQCNFQQITMCLEYMTKFLSEVEQKTFKDIDETKVSFRFKDETYFYPLFKFKDTTFGDYIEASQLNMLTKKEGGNRFSVLAEQMAIMCKTKDESKEYDEKRVMKKSRVFENLPMNIVWDFVFFLTSQTNTYQRNLETYSKKGIGQATDIPEKIGA
tara:strand:- start:1628 stop:2314 length:687 start_codon:yes stop_codon:yes gene_type:complete